MEHEKTLGNWNTYYLKSLENLWGNIGLDYRFVTVSSLTIIELQRFVILSKDLNQVCFSKFLTLPNLLMCDLMLVDGRSNVNPND